MSDSMIERVAWVIFREFGDKTRGMNPADDYKSMKVAALVLSAMREPTEAMLEGAGSMEGFDGCELLTGPDKCHIDWWQAMIEAALNETDPQVTHRSAAWPAPDANAN